MNKTSKSTNTKSTEVAVRTDLVAVPFIKEKAVLEPKVVDLFNTYLFYEFDSLLETCWELLNLYDYDKELVLFNLLLKKHEEELKGI